MSNVYLRLMTEEDTDLIVSWRNKEIVRKNFIFQELFTKEIHEEWISTMINTGKVVQMIICEKSLDKPIGTTYLRDIDVRHNKAEFGIFIGEESALGKGYGTEAAKLMVDYGFRKLNLHRIFLRVFAENLVAIRSYEKVGFVKEGVLNGDVCIDGEYRDLIWMAITNPQSF